MPHKPDLRPVIDTQCMSNTIPAAGAAVPEKITEAERWRLAGKRLRAASPEMFEQMIAMVVASLPNDDDESDDSMTESYFLA